MARFDRSCHEFVNHLLHLETQFASGAATILSEKPQCNYLLLHGAPDRMKLRTPMLLQSRYKFIVAAHWAIRSGAAAAGSGATCLPLESSRRAWCGHPPGCAWPNTLLARGGLTSGGSVRAFRRLGALMLRAGRVIPALLGVHLQSEQGGDIAFIQHFGCGRR